ncbi:hypothetical protein VTN96DRAFT_2324 [Rasamsonia emersonii]
MKAKKSVGSQELIREEFALLLKDQGTKLRVSGLGPVTQPATQPACTIGVWRQALGLATRDAFLLEVLTQAVGAVRTRRRYCFGVAAPAAVHWPIMAAIVE